MNRIAIFCGSKTGNNPAFTNAAKEIGKEIAKRKIELVYGGAGVGLMGHVANSALEHDGKVIGVIPEKLYELEVAHMGLTKLYRVKTMHERKALMADLSDAFIALPGGIGTMEEIMEVMTWAQIGYHSKSCAFLNIHGYYDELLQFFTTMEKSDFLYGTISEHFVFESNVHTLLDQVID